MFTFPFSELSNDEFLGFFPRNYDEYDNHIYWYGNWYPNEAAEYPEALDDWYIEAPPDNDWSTEATDNNGEALDGNWYPEALDDGNWYPEAPDENNGEAPDDEYEIEH